MHDRNFTQMRCNSGVPWPRLFALVLALTVTAGCSSTRTTASPAGAPVVSAPAPAPAVWTDPASGLGFPAELGAAKFLGHRVYPQPGLGVSVRYVTASDLRADIFVYNGGNAQIPDGADGAVVVREASNGLRDVRTVVKAGKYQKLREIREDDAVFGVGAAKADFRRVTFVFDRQGTAYDSELYITGHRRHFVKVRATYPLAQRAAGRRDLHALLNALGARIAQDGRNLAALW